MIILDDTQATLPHEQSPLKGPSRNPQPSRYQSPPPPYGAVGPAASSPHSPQPGAGINWQHNGPPPAFYTPPAQNRNANRSAAGRFIRAYLISILVIFLWGLLIGGIEIAFHDHPEHPFLSVRGWVKDNFGVGPGRHPVRRSPSERVECVTIPAVTPTPPLRPLPINYPPFQPETAPIPLPTY
ncbi:hypothetical protein FA15DRAFT_657937 [Coprinopsis marcescibilis]|uniref:Uncharacterized protein n=1 Tax=Coprinopsis marcescibilis TaxID=230819 RepID=A0A5C3KPH5_COPMA|nr:hypothetical protein FA15DRAFT_657937 [Coprinopsis marcescibilis]